LRLYRLVLSSSSFARKVISNHLFPALPPDVRRGYAAPFNLELGDGLRPRFGLARIFIGQRPNQGPSPTLYENCDGAAQPRLTSGGRAVPGVSKVLFGQSQFKL
jgi:hypothetical protein